MFWGCALFGGKPPPVAYVQDVTNIPVEVGEGLIRQQGCQDKLFGYPLSEPVTIRSVALKAGINQVLWVEQESAAVGPVVRSCVTVFGTHEDAPAAVTDDQ